MIFALAVASSIIGGMVPLFAVINQYRTDCEAVLLSQRLKYVREISSRADAFALVSGRTYEGLPKMYLDEKNHRYLYRIGNKVKRSWQYGSDVKISCNRPEMSFSRNGEATAGTYTVTGRSKIRRVVIDRVGRIRIE